MTEKRFNARKNIDNDYFEERLKVELENIVGIVEIDDVTNSVELKKEYYNSKSKNKRYEEMYSKYCGLVVADMSTNPRICSARRISDMEIVDELNQLNDENEQLKKELFESEKNYIIETYSDNQIRRDEKIQSLKEEFKARFGDVE